MKIHEYQGKELFRRYGIPVPNGVAAMSIEAPEPLADFIAAQFSRDVADFNHFLYGLIRQGVTVHSLTEEIPEGLAGGFLLSAKAYSSADFSEQLSKNIKRGIAERVTAGYNNGGQAPRGTPGDRHRAR